MEEPRSLSQATELDPAASVTPSAEPQRPATKSRRSDVINALVGAVVLGIVAYWIFWRGDQQTPQPPEAETAKAAADTRQDGAAAAAPRRDPEAPIACTGTIADSLGNEPAPGFGPDLTVVPAGAYLMGGDGESVDAMREVRIAAPFAISVCEITALQYEAFVRATGRSWPRETGLSRTTPAALVSWRDAVAYTEWLSVQSGRPYRLPSEAEWEWAARGGAESDSTGASANPCADANVRSGPRGASQRCANSQKPAEIGVARANAFGLRDMLGNVAEWTADCYRAPLGGDPRDGTAFDSRGCAERVLRGGSWVSTWESSRPGFRAHSEPDFRDYTIGFRVARPLNADEAGIAPMAVSYEPEPAAEPRPRAQVQDLEIVDCLLPPQIRVGGGRTSQTPRRPTRTTAQDCRKRGGEYPELAGADVESAVRQESANAEVESAAQDGKADAAAAVAAEPPPPLPVAQTEPPPSGSPKSYYVIALTASQNNVNGEIKRLREIIGPAFEKDFPDVQPYGPPGSQYVLLVSGRSLPYGQANELKNSAIKAGFSSSTWLWSADEPYFDVKEGRVAKN